ncbi:hypothetical protein [Amycolatopsis alkalitolerans]|nr:hypothetical protein [Amycolatopsis alkalitolerans]
MAAVARSRDQSSAVASVSWDDVMRERLFDPVGLTSTNSRHDHVD